MKRENRYKQTKMTGIKLYISKVIEMDKWGEIDMFEKLEGVFVLFKKISRKVKAIWPFIVYVNFIIIFFLFSQFI